MKKTVFLLVFIAFGIAINSQILPKGPLGFQRSEEKVNPFIKNRTYGDIFWEEDFNATKWENTVLVDSLGLLLDTAAPLPEGWSFIDSTNLNYHWHWSNVGPRGAYTVGSDNDPFTPDNTMPEFLPEGTSYNNGFMLLESDYFNTNEEGEIVTNVTDMSSFFQYGPIDFSDAPGVIFNCKIIDRLCCSLSSFIGLHISTNFNPNTNEGDWEAFKLNTHPMSSTTYPQDRDFHVNISDLVVGQSEVYFRIGKQNASHYFVIIDDIKFYEPPTHDLVLNDAWADYMYDAEEENYSVYDYSAHNFWGGYTQIPQIAVSEFIKFRAAVFNSGTQDAINSTIQTKIFRDTNLVFNQNSEPKTVIKNSEDTLKLYTRFIPEELGIYQVSMTIVQNAQDENPDDNAWEYNFEVVENMYSRVYHENEDENFYPAGPRDWAMGGYDGDICAQPYDFPDIGDIRVKGIKVWIDDHAGLEDELAAIEAGNYYMIGRLFKMDRTGNISDTEISSKTYYIQPGDTASWVTLNFVNNGNLSLESNQTYYAAIAFYTGTEQDLRFQIGTDNSIKQPKQGGFIHFVSQPAWYITGYNYAIDLILDVEPKVNLTFNVDMTDTEGFIVATDTIYASGTFNNWTEPGQNGALILTDENNDLVYSATIQVDYNQTIQYKYFMNAGWEGDEWEGNPNRKVEIIETDVETNDIWGFYENAIYSDHKNNFILYPNPFNNSLTISNRMGYSIISIRDISGKTVLLISTDEKIITIPTQSFEKGVYLVSILNSNKTTTKKVIKR